jgi:very-short-patch-repair endonuclease
VLHESVKTPPQEEFSRSRDDDRSLAEHWPGTNQIVELDGWEGHRSRSAFREDRERDRRLRVAGYAVTRLTWNQLEDEPEQIAADLRALLGSSEI